MQVKVIPCKSCKVFFHNMPALSTMNQLVKCELHVLHEIWNLNFRSSFVYIINNKAVPLHQSKWYSFIYLIKYY